MNKTTTQTKHFSSSDALRAAHAKTTTQLRQQQKITEANKRLIAFDLTYDAINETSLSHVLRAVAQYLEANADPRALRLAHKISNSISEAKFLDNQAH